MTAITSCMGGWCTKRDHCAHYHAATPTQTPAERLCPPGQDGAGLTAFMETPMPKKMPLEDRMDQAEALLNDDGVTLDTIIAAFGMCRTQCVRIITRLCRAGRAFRFRAKLVEDAPGSGMHALFFKTASARDLYATSYQARMKERARARQRFHANAWKARNPDKVRASIETYRPKAAARSRDYRAKKAAERSPVAAARLAEQRQHREAKAAAAEARKREAADRAQARALRRAAAEQAKERARLEREAKAAEKDRAKAEAKKTKERLKAETKAAGALKFKKGTDSPAPPKPRGPAFVAGDPIIPPGVEVKRLPSAPASRWDTSGAKPVVSSNECRAWAREAVAA